jgi:hypothetical protein
VRSRTHFAALCVAAFLAFLVASLPAVAAPKPISGQLSKGGYTVIALAASGKGSAVRAPRGRFRLTPPAERVTLHLRASNGKYAGPIMVASRRQGRLAILGVRAGARLGGISVRGGYARVRRNLRQSSVDTSRSARARRGVPIGAKRFGRVRSRRAGRGAPGDGDLDGVPDVLDVDDDGDLVLDEIDRSARASAAQAPSEFSLHSVLGLPPEAVLNANAAAVSDQQIDATLETADGAYLIVNGILPGVELDCSREAQQPPRPTGLRYCSPGGTGRVFGSGPTRAAWRRFPDDFDADGNGMGTPPITPGPLSSAFFLSHGATTAQIGTGDIVIRRTATEAIPATLQFLFATVPALSSYSDTAGNSAQARYPVAPGDPGTNTNGFPAGAPSGQDVVLTLSFWRPQRRPIPGEKCPEPNGDPCAPDQWIDIGGLTYGAIVQHIGEVVGGTEVARGCPSTSLSSSHLTVTPGPGPSGGAAMVDRASDQPANPANTFTYTLNLSQCLRELGVSWNPGEPLHLTNLGLSANGGGDAEETVVFKRQ